LIFSVGKLMGARLGQVNELGEMHGLRDLYLRNGQEFQVLHARRTDGDDPWGDMGATGKKLTCALVSSRSTPMSPATVATENSAVPRFRHEGRILAQKRFAAGVL
jgi:hypothetical protein